MDLGYVTHAVHANSRMVYLRLISSDPAGGVLVVEGPPSGGVYPPGPGWLYVVSNGIPSEGRPVMVGSGKAPPMDKGALTK